MVDVVDVSVVLLLLPRSVRKEEGAGEADSESANDGRDGRASAAGCADTAGCVDCDGREGENGCINDSRWPICTLLLSCATLDDAVDTAVDVPL